MSRINFDSIKNKVQTNDKVNKKIASAAEKIAQKQLQEKSGAIYNTLDDVANDMIHCLISRIEGLRAETGFANGNLGNTAADALINNLTYNIYYNRGQGTYEIWIYFNDMERESLMPEKYPEGVRNLADLLNSGYDAGNTVYGVWHGHGDNPIYSLVHRNGAHFTEGAIKDFLGNYAGTYSGIEIKSISQT